MQFAFADACYFIALINPRDQLHKKAVAASKTRRRLLITEEVLTEILNFYCKHGAHFREKATKVVESIIGDPNITVVPQTRESFKRGLRFYGMRTDKDYSLVDCISMETMKDRDIVDILSNDNHFTQEKFNILL